MNKEEFRYFVTDEIAVEDYQKSVAHNIVAQCIGVVEGIASNEANSMIIPLIVFRCVSLAFINTCPIESQDTSEECVKMRNSVRIG